MNIATMTMNPSIDISTRSDRVVPGMKLRCDTPRYDPGGGGINVCMVIRELGGDSVAIFPFGGPPGSMLRRLLDGSGITQRPVEIDDWTRQNIAVLNRQTEEQLRFVMPGPRMSGGEADRCMDELKALEPKPDYLLISGSLPRGIAPDFMRGPVSFANKNDIRCIVDSSGDSLQHAADEGLFLLKPNLPELKTLVGYDVSEEPEQERALRELVESGKCRYALLSMGAAGAALASGEGIKRFRAPVVSIVSRVGAGDSMVAGLILGLSRGYDIEKAVSLGIAAGSAAVITPATELCRREDVERLFDRMTGSKKGDE